MCLLCVLAVRGRPQGCDSRKSSSSAPDRALCLLLNAPRTHGQEWEEWWLQDSGVFSKKTESKGMQEQMLSNPDMMTNLMKQNLTGIVPQVYCG